MTLCTEIEKEIVKYIWKHKRPQIVTGILSKYSSTASTTVPDFKLYYRIITIRTAWYWHKIIQEYTWAFEGCLRYKL
jgi:hypothetical protein